MKKMTTKLSLAAALTLAFATMGAPVAHAEEAAPAHAFSFNAAVTSDYRYRGLSQTRLQPALQGGADYTHNPSGFYAGVWGSTIKWIKDLKSESDNQVELDFYAGKRGEIVPGVSYDVGGLYYRYPNDFLNPSANTFEFYGQVGYGPAYFKYSESTTNLFGTAGSKGSAYYDIGANFEMATGLMLNLHVGRQYFANGDNIDNSQYTYTDYKIGLTKDLGFASLAAAVIKADTKAFPSPKNGKNLSKGGIVLTLSKTF